MGEMDLSRNRVEKALNKVHGQLINAITWVCDQEENIRLEVSQPYEHIIVPYIRNCHPAGADDDCGDIGIMMAVFARMREKGLKTTAKAKSRR